MKKLIFFFIGVLFLGCGGKELNHIPDEIIPKHHMIDLLVDIHLSDAIITTKKFQTNKHEYQIEGYYAYLYEKHGYTRQEIDSSIAFYSRYPAEYSKMYDQVLEKLSTIQTYYEKKDTIK